MNKDFLEVALAIISHKNKFLIGLRKDYNLWEFPGGKIEIKKKETPDEAIKREVFEEIGIHIQIPPVNGVCFAELNQNKRYIFHIFKITEWNGTLQNKFHEQLKWMTPHEINNLKTHELNKILFPYIF